MEDTYKVSVWEMEDEDEETGEWTDGGWRVVRSGLTKWQLRTALNELYDEWNMPLHIQVMAETHEREAARWNRSVQVCARYPRRILRNRRELQAERNKSKPRAKRKTKQH